VQKSKLKKQGRMSAKYLIIGVHLTNLAGFGAVKVADCIEMKLKKNHITTH